MFRLLRDETGDRRRIVVTGVGVVSSAGRTTASFWDALTRSAGAGAAQGTGSDEFSQRNSGVADFSGRIDDFCELPAAMRKAIHKALKLMNRETQMGVAAGQQALRDSGVQQHHAPERIGICFGAENVSVMPEDFQAGVDACSDGAGGFDMDRWGTDGISQVAPLWLLKCLPNMAACHLAIINDLRGPGNTITQRDVAVNMAVAEACRAILDDDADVMVVGGTGTTLSTFNLMHARLEEDVVDGQDDGVCRPFDRRRRASVPGEGAGVIVLEELLAALRRGAPIYGEILAAASASCVGQDAAAGCRKALTSALRLVLQRADLPPEFIGHIHAHGLGTRKSDLAEAQAIAQVLGESSGRIPVVAAKSQLANAGAGAGALEVIASLLALKHGHLFPVRNFREPDPECPVRPVTGCDDAAGTSFLNLNMFGRGLASCMAVGTFRG